MVLRTYDLEQCTNLSSYHAVLDQIVSESVLKQVGDSPPKQAWVDATHHDTSLLNT